MGLISWFADRVDRKMVSAGDEMLTAIADRCDHDSDYARHIGVALESFFASVYSDNSDPLFGLVVFERELNEGDPLRWDNLAHEFAKQSKRDEATGQIGKSIAVRILAAWIKIVLVRRQRETEGFGPATKLSTQYELFIRQLIYTVFQPASHGAS